MASSTWLFAGGGSRAGCAARRFYGELREWRIGHRNGEKMIRGADMAEDELGSNLVETKTGFAGVLVFDLSGKDDRGDMIIIVAQDQADGVHTRHRGDRIGACRKRPAIKHKLEGHLDPEVINILVLGFDGDARTGKTY